MSPAEKDLFERHIGQTTHDSLFHRVLEDDGRMAKYYIGEGRNSREEISQIFAFAAAYLLYDQMKILSDAGADPKEAVSVLRVILLRKNLKGALSMSSFYQSLAKEPLSLMPYSVPQMPAFSTLLIALLMLLKNIMQP